MSELPDGGADRNTTLVNWPQSDPVQAMVCTGSIADAVVLAAPLFRDLNAGPTLRRLGQALWQGRAVAPLFILGRASGTIFLHTQVRLGDRDALFVRAGTVHVAGKHINFPALLSEAVSHAERHREFLNNHQCCYVNFWPGYEIEHKITLTEPVDIHGIAVDLRNLVGSCEMPGYIWDYRDDYQMWDFDNHMFAIAEPVGDAGYISFIPDSTGTVIVKRKWFIRDTIRRRETRWRNVAIPVTQTGFDTYLRTEAKVNASYVGSFRRTRFDTTCEATRTGNVYGLMVDWCRPLRDLQYKHLYQVEIEYLHSRTLARTSADAVDEELRFLVDVVQRYLRSRNISHVTGGESKLTYMRSLNRSGACWLC
ncbi:MAG: hypothetical protein ACRDQU_21525 [Pseudonocardiaceae bacterium]